MSDKKSGYVLRQYSQIADIPALDWDACAGGANPFVSHAFLSALEASGSARPENGWIPQHISFSANGLIEAVMPAYGKLHSYGEYVFDQGWAEAFENAGGTYYPKLQICVPFSPVTGARLLRRSGSTLSTLDIGNALKALVAEKNMSSAHVTFCEETEWQGLAHAGWLQRMGVQFHWRNQGYKNFDDFLGALSASHRKSIRRERRDANAAGLTFETLRGDDIKTEHWDAFYHFYQNTVDRKWGSAYLTRDFFTQLSPRLGDKVILMMAFYDNTPVAGAMNLLGDNTLYGRNWGCIGQWPFLHFELCYYRAIDFAIENGLERVEAGAQGEHKVQRGYLPQATYSAHFFTHQGLSDAVRNFLAEERKGVEANREILADYSPFRKSAT